MPTETEPITWTVTPPDELTNARLFDGAGNYLGPEEVFARLLELARAVGRLGLVFIEPDLVVVHAGPYDVADLVLNRVDYDRNRTPHAARLFRGSADATLDHAAARAALAELGALVDRLPDEVLER